MDYIFYKNNGELHDIVEHFDIEVTRDPATGWLYSEEWEGKKLIDGLTVMNIEDVLEDKDTINYLAGMMDQLNISDADKKKMRQAFFGNDMQNLVLSISGYHPNSDKTSSRDEGFHDLLLKQREEKIQYLKSFVALSDDIDELELDKIERVLDFLESDFKGSSERYYAFQELK